MSTSNIGIGLPIPQCAHVTQGHLQEHRLVHRSTETRRLLLEPDLDRRRRVRTAQGDVKPYHPDFARYPRAPTPNLEVSHPYRRGRTIGIRPATPARQCRKAKICCTIRESFRAWGCAAFVH